MLKGKTMKRFLILISILLLALAMTGCGNTNTPDNDETSPYENDDITIHIPRELFFTGDSEEAVLTFFEESGGIVTEPAEDIDTFWMNYPDNAGTVCIEVRFSPSDLATAGLELENDILFYLDAIATVSDPISAFQIETSEALTRFVFIGSFVEIAQDRRIVELLDFTFPYLGQMEYLRRIVQQYNMADLKEITFYLEDHEMAERFELYSFFQDAPPLGLCIHH